MNKSELLEAVRCLDSCPKCNAESQRGDVPIKDLPSNVAVMNTDCDDCLRLVVELIRAGQ